jgi:hypothetical protein
MDHTKVVSDIKAQRQAIAEASAEITRLRSEAFQKIEDEAIVLRQQLSGLKVSKKEVEKA